MLFTIPIKLKTHVVGGRVKYYARAIFPTFLPKFSTKQTWTKNRTKQAMTNATIRTSFSSPQKNPIYTISSTIYNFSLKKLNMPPSIPIQFSQPLIQKPYHDHSSLKNVQNTFPFVISTKSRAVFSNTHVRKSTLQTRQKTVLKLPVKKHIYCYRPLSKTLSLNISTTD